VSATLAKILAAPTALRAGSIDFRAWISKIGRLLGVTFIAIFAGIAAAKSNQYAVVLIGVVLLCLYVGCVIGYPRAAIIIMCISLALIPVYAVPTFRSFYPEPTALAALIVTAILFRAGGRLRFTVVDLAFAATCGAMILASLLGPHSLFSTISELFLWVPPYLAGRTICKRIDGPHVLALGAVAAGLISLPFIAYETVTGHNVFFSLARPNSELTKLWAHPAFRPGGLLRSQAGFGHPLSMALIMSSCGIFALGLALRTNTRRRAILLLVAVGLVVAQYTSYERSGWFVFIGGALLLAAMVIPPETRIRHALIAAAIVIPLAFLAASATHPSNGEASVARTESTADRVNLWRHAFEPGTLGLVGLPETQGFNHFVNALRPGKTAIDSGYLQIADIYGVIAFIALFTVVAAVVRVAVAVRGSWVAVIPAVALVDLIALAVIGFQTQIPIFVWLVVGAVSGVDLRRRSLANQSPGA
jgi:hypothetical protein